MPVARERHANNVIYTLEGPLDSRMAREFFYYNYEDYRKIGDALGAIIDFRAMTRVTISGLRTIQELMRGVVFDTPVAFVGRPDPVVRAFLSGLEAISSRMSYRFRFFYEQDYSEPLVAAAEWVDAWYELYERDREALYGYLSTQVPLIRLEEEESVGT